MSTMRYAAYRMVTMLLTLVVVSVLVFAIINLPPGDYLSNQINELQATGQSAGVAKAEFLRREYSLDQPLWKQYLIWVGFVPGPNGYAGLLQGDYGWSFEFDRPVAEIVGDSLWLTVVVNLAAILFIYAVALPLGMLAAAKSRTWIDYGAALVAYLGLATPNFLLALILFYYGNKYFDLPIGGLMDPIFEDQPLTWDKLQSILVHLIVPTFVIGTSGASAMTQRLRANMLDELGKPYVETAIAKGLSERRMLVKYPLRVAFNPFVADIGNLLPSMVSGSVLVSVVLGLQTIGPALLTALKTQDQFLSGFILMFVALLTLIGTMISDILLVMLDPRIRYEGRES
ncbi:MAG: ABC transporter permease [Marinibacterium sp.]